MDRETLCPEKPRSVELTVPRTPFLSNARTANFSVLSSNCNKLVFLTVKILGLISETMEDQGYHYVTSVVFFFNLD